LPGTSCPLKAFALENMPLPLSSFVNTTNTIILLLKNYFFKPFPIKKKPIPWLFFRGWT